MSEEISDAELVRLMAEAVDENGVDVALERATAAMSPEVRRASEENIRRWVGRARAAMVTDEELTAALAAAEDEDGVDQRLAAMTAAMTDEEREQAQASVQRWIDAARRSRENERAAPDNV